jgi:hypothetical protein
MPSAEEKVRMEIAFEGGQSIAAHVPAAAADALDRALGGENGRVFALDADDGRYLIALERVLYVKRFTRESRIGFGGAS